MNSIDNVTQDDGCKQRPRQEPKCLPGVPVRTGRVSLVAACPSERAGRINQLTAIRPCPCLLTSCYPYPFVTAVLVQSTYVLQKKNMFSAPSHREGGHLDAEGQSHGVALRASRLLGEVFRMSCDRLMKIIRQPAGMKLHTPKQVKCESKGCEHVMHPLGNLGSKVVC